MSDLILNIDFDESSKKNYIVIETYQGKIPNLKSNKFSGQLRKININIFNEFDNLSSAELEYVKKFLLMNRKISKNMYLINGSMFKELSVIKDLKCLFYKDKNRDMFKVLEFSNIYNKSLDYIKENNYIYFYDKTRLSICSTEKETREDSIVSANFYISSDNKYFCGELTFEYDNYRINYGEKNLFLSEINSYRDYSYEENIVNLIKGTNWEINKDNKFIFQGKEIYYSIKLMINSGIKVFTNNGHKVNTGSMNNVSINYGIDWFDVKGEVTVDNHTYGLKEIIKALNNKNHWIEIGEDRIFLSDKEFDYLKNLNEEDGKVGYDKKQLLTVVDLSSNKSVGIGNIANLFKNDSPVTVPENIWKILRNYQKEGVKWLSNRCKNGFGVCLADDMGLGKTLQVIAFLSQTEFRNKLNIIIVPMTLLINWKREIEKFSPNLKIMIYHGSNRNLDEVKSANILLTTYGTCLNDIDKLSKIDFSCMVIDEAQYIKSYKSKSYKAILNIKASSKILLTGTPMENNLLEYWNLMHLLNPEYLPTYTKLKNITNSENELVKLVKKVTSPFILRRMKKDVLDELPEKNIETIFCEFYDEQYYLYKTIQDSIRDYINSDNEKNVIKNSSVYVLQGLLRLRQVCCDPRLLPLELNKNGILKSSKTDYVLTMINDLLLNDHKIVLYSDFPPMLKIIKKNLDRQKINTFYLDGSTNNRQNIVDEFEKTPKSVFLISLKAGGTGLNLVSADTAIIYNPWWNPAAEKQAEDRIYRIGQKNKVTVYKLIMANSIEEKMQNLQNEKLNISEQLLEDSSGISKFSIDELKKLLL